MDNKKLLLAGLAVAAVAGIYLYSKKKEKSQMPSNSPSNGNETSLITNPNYKDEYGEFQEYGERPCSGGIYDVICNDGSCDVSNGIVAPCYGKGGVKSKI